MSMWVTVRSGGGLIGKPGVVHMQPHQWQEVSTIDNTTRLSYEVMSESVVKFIDEVSMVPFRSRFNFEGSVIRS